MDHYYILPFTHSRENIPLIPADLDPKFGQRLLDEHDDRAAQVARRGLERLRHRQDRFGQDLGGVRMMVIVAAVTEFDKESGLRNRPSEDEALCGRLGENNVDCEIVTPDTKLKTEGDFILIVLNQF